MDVAKIRVVTEAVTGDATKQLGKLDKQVEETGKSTDDFEKTWKSMKTALVGSVATIAAVGAAMKEVYDIGREGAVFEQTEASFNRLEESLGPNIDLLEELHKKSNNTVDDLTLMSSTLTLVAGTSGEFQESLLLATPELLEVAKAANKLNPTLGDTAFLYESIATGVKRGSPLILDNLGLMVKVGDANEAYAEQLGKTVDELTATEKQQALLNDVLRAGDDLIKQAGDDTESMTDGYDRLAVSVKDFTTELKTMTNKGLEPALPAFEAFLDYNLFMLQTIQKYNLATGVVGALFDIFSGGTGS